MRRQPPVYSPISLTAVAEASFAAVCRGRSELAAFEALHRDRYSADQVRLTSSGTHALQLGLTLLPEVRAGERVVAMPGYSCYDLVTAAVGAGVRIRFYDVDPGTLSPDLDSLRAVVAEGVSGVVVAHLYGHPVDWPSIRSITDEAGLPVIEDAAQGLGSSGTLGVGGELGDLTVLSMGRGKGWTGGGGGALLARTARGPLGAWVVDRLKERVVASGGRQGWLGSALMAAAAWTFGRPSLYGIPRAVPALRLGETIYHEPTSIRGMPWFNAALARRTASAAASAVEPRRLVASTLVESLGHIPHVRPVPPLGGTDRASFLRLPVLADTRELADRLEHQGRHGGVEPGYPKPLHRLSPAGPVTIPGPRALPGSVALSQRLLTLPTHHWMRQAQLDELVRLLRSPG